MAASPHAVTVTDGARATEEPTAAPEGPNWLDDEEAAIAYLTRVERPDDFLAGYDPERVREAIERYAGSWSDIDTDQFLAELYEARRRSTQRPSRP